MNDFIFGAIMTAYLVAGMFFLRFWRRTHDRLFAMFGIAFLVLAAQRVGLLLAADSAERVTFWYVVRLLAFLLIILAIVDKNRTRAKR